MTDFNAAAVTHVLSTAGESIIASKHPAFRFGSPGRSLREALQPNSTFKIFSKA